MHPIGFNILPKSMVIHSAIRHKVECSIEIGHHISGDIPPRLVSAIDMIVINGRKPIPPNVILVSMMPKIHSRKTIHSAKLINEHSGSIQTLSNIWVTVKYQEKNKQQNLL